MPAARESDRNFAASNAKREIPRTERAMENGSTPNAARIDRVRSDADLRCGEAAIDWRSWITGVGLNSGWSYS